MNANNKDAWTSANDSLCATVATTNCRNRGTGISEAFGTKAWTGANDFRCANVHNNCRSKDTKLAIALTDKTGFLSLTDAQCTDTTDSTCISTKAVTGVPASGNTPAVAAASIGQLVAIGSNAWSTADDATCNSMPDNYCRDTTKLAKWFDSVSKTGRTSSIDGKCADATNSQCRDSAATKQ